MKKFFVLAAMAAFALCACEQNNPVVDGSGTQNGGDEQTAAGVVLDRKSVV